MNIKRAIAIGLLLSTLLLRSGSTMAQSGQASDENADIPKVIKDCDNLYPKYPRTEDRKIDASQVGVLKPYKGKYGLNFRIAFEKARTSYHAYVECIFEGAVTSMLETAGGDTSGIFGANAPNMPEWMRPESVCPNSEQAFAEKLKSVGPESLLKFLMENYNEYVDYINLLYSRVSNRPLADEGAGVEPIDVLVEKNDFFRFLVENEIQDALVALDGALIGLKEMRQAYVMHVHFQCMLKNLEFYRRAFENLRRVISALPSVIIDASIHK